MVAIFEDGGESEKLAEDQRPGLLAAWCPVGASRRSRRSDEDIVRQVMGAANQLEASMVSARLRGGRRHKESNGGYGGGFVRHGWAVVGQGKDAKLIEVEAEQKVLKRMRRLRKKHTLRAIAAKLNADGVTAKHGGPWTHASVRSALRHA